MGTEVIALMAHDLGDEPEKALERLQAELPLSVVKPYFAYRRLHLERDWKLFPRLEEDDQTGLDGPYTLLRIYHGVVSVWFPTSWRDFLTEERTRARKRELFGRFARLFGQESWVYCGDTSDPCVATMEETLASLRRLYGDPAPTIESIFVEYPEYITADG